jgi:hypothetical protein
MPGIKLKINSAHISGAIKGDASHCMIAESIRTKFPQARWILVDAQTIRWTDRSQRKRYKYLTPLAAQRALVKFDSDEPVAPFTINLGRPVIITPLRPVAKRRPQNSKMTKGKKHSIGIASPKEMRKRLLAAARGEAPPVTKDAKHKHKKTAPESSAMRTHGLRNLA